MNGRVEDAVTGRFVSADPNVPDPSDSQSFNRYSYVNNNPLTLTDPSGFCTPWWACKQINGVPGAGCKMCAGVGDPGAGPGLLGAEMITSNQLAGTDESFAGISDPTVPGQPGYSATVTYTLPNTVDENGLEVVNVCSGCTYTVPLPAPNLSVPFPQGNVSVPKGQTQTTQPPQGNPHNYVISRSTQCSASDAFSQLKQPGMSAPGAPAAQEGFTPQINLPGLTSPNPISQLVNSSTMTITNTTLQGHVFYPGSVVIQVTPNSGGGSQITITGTGTGNYPEINDLVGEAVFGTIAGSVANVCDPSAGP